MLDSLAVSDISQKTCWGCFIEFTGLYRARRLGKSWDVREARLLKEDGRVCSLIGRPDCILRRWNEGYEKGGWIFKGIYCWVDKEVWRLNRGIWKANRGFKQPNNPPKIWKWRFTFPKRGSNQITIGKPWANFCNESANSYIKGYVRWFTISWDGVKRKKNDEWEAQIRAY